MKRCPVELIIKEICQREKCNAILPIKMAKIFKFYNLQLGKVQRECKFRLFRIAIWQILSKLKSVHNPLPSNSTANNVSYGNYGYAQRLCARAENKLVFA